MGFNSHYPDIALHLQFSSYDRFELVCQDSFWNGRRNHSWLYTSPAEISEWKSTLNLDQIDILYVYGLGLGHYASALQEWLAQKQSRQLIFLEDDLAIFEAFSRLPTSELINHPQIHLRWIGAPEAWDDVLEQCAAQFSFDKIEVSALKAYEKSARFRKIKLSLLRKTILWHAVTAENISGHLLHQNIVPNLRRIPHCSYINQWKEAWKGTPVIICGAGPSLQTIADDLRKVRDRALIIGCGSALSVLAHLGIRPHLGIAIDPNAREFDCLQGCTYRDLPLLFGSRLYPKVFELFDGPFGYIRSGTGSALECHVEEQLGMKDPFLGYDLGREALSVTTLALSLAQAWGCNPIILAGVDLAYASEKHYADGVPPAASSAAALDRQEKRAGEQLIRRKGAQGKQVSTCVKWVMERDTIDAYAKSHPQTTFLNVSSGLGFQHIPHTSLREIHLPPSANYDEKVASLLARTTIPASMQEVENILGSIRSSFEQCLELFCLLQQEESSSGKSILYQTDLETQPAYQLLLRSSLRTLERIGQSRDPASLEQDKWHFLANAARSYLASI